MIEGTSKIRHWGIEDPVMKRMLEERGLEEIPLYRLDSPKRQKADWSGSIEFWEQLAEERDGPVNQVRTDFTDISAATREIKRVAREMGASDVGISELTPDMLGIGITRNHPTIISLIFEEKYEHVMEGALGVEQEAVRVYITCAKISTKIAAHIRDLGYSAIADHNGTMEVQAIPALYAAGLGEMGRHGSLIHPEYGAGFRPGFVTTDMTLLHDSPIKYGVQDFCMQCNVCSRNCPPDAIPPPDDYITTNGQKRWLTNVEACYHASRLREEYCHICVDVCPYNTKETSNETRRSTFRLYMAKRRQAGHRAPSWFIEDEEKVLANGPMKEIFRS